MKEIRTMGKYTFNKNTHLYLYNLSVFFTKNIDDLEIAI